MAIGSRGGSLRDIFISFGFAVDDRALRVAERSIFRLTNASVALGVAFTGMSVGLGALLREGGKAEVLDVTFESLLGNAEAAKTKVEELLTFAKNTPFTLDGVLVNAKQLLAMSIEADKLIPTLTILGNAAATLDVPLKQLARNFGQVKARGRLLGRDLNDFATAGINVAEIIGVALGKSTGDVLDLVSRRLISFEMVEDAFKRLSDEGGMFFDIMAKRSRTFPGQMDKIRETIQLMAREIGTELLPGAKDLQKRFLAFLEVNKDIIKANITGFMKEFLRAIRGGVALVRDIGLTVRELARVFGVADNAGTLLFHTMSVLFGVSALLAVSTMLNAVNKFGKAMLLVASRGLITALFRVGPLTLFALAIIDIIGYMNGLDTVTGRLLKKWEKDFPESFKIVRWEVEQLTKAYDNLMTSAAKIFNFFADRTPKQATTDIGGALKTAATLGMFGPILLGLNQGGITKEQITDFFKGGLIKSVLFPSQGNTSTIGNTTINVTTGSGDPVLIGQEISKQVRQTFEPMLRKASAATAPGVQ